MKLTIEEIEESNKTWFKRYKQSKYILQEYEINLDKILRKQLF